MSDASEFGSWFGMRADGPFESGRRIRATVAPTTADEQVAEMQKPYEGQSFEIVVERMEPERLLSFRWTHDAEAAKGSTTLSTLVEMTLIETESGVLLTITESGFDQIPPDRRAKLFADNEQGWIVQMKLIEAHLTRNP